GVELLSHNPLLTDSYSRTSNSLVAGGIYGRLDGFVPDQRNFTLGWDQQGKLFAITDARLVLLFCRGRFTELLGQGIDRDGGIFRWGERFHRIHGTEDQSGSIGQAHRVHRVFENSA